MVLRCDLSIAVMFLAVSAFSGAHAAEWFVDASVSGSGDGTTPETAFQTIQEGIDTAADGHTVIVAKGTYVENIQFKGKNIILRSADPTYQPVVKNTVIDGDKAAAVVTFSGDEDETCVLSGFTIRNGDRVIAGGGIHGGDNDKATRARIENNIITGNSSFWGGGAGFLRRHDPRQYHHGQFSLRRRRSGRLQRRHSEQRDQRQFLQYGRGRGGLLQRHHP